MHAGNSCRELRKGRQRNEVQRDSLAKRMDRACPKVAEYKTERRYHEKPNEEKFFFHAHGHPPRPIGRPGGLSQAHRDGSDRYDLPADGWSSRGALSPISRTLLSSSDICMPESASKSAGTWAAIFVMSPVSL